MSGLPGRYATGARIESEDRLAGGLLFFVLTRTVLVLEPDGAATLEDEIVVDSWYEPVDFDATRAMRLWKGTWSASDDRGCTLELHNAVLGDVTAYARVVDGAFLVVDSWEGEHASGERVFERR